MRKAAATLLLFLLALATNPGRAQDSASLGARVDECLKPYLATGNFSGAILIGQGGRVLLAKGFGLADVENSVPNTPQTVFHLASTSRVLTSTAVMLLAAERGFDLGAKLSAHLPDFPNGDKITLHHLLTLSAGFPNINGLPGYDAWSLEPQTPELLVARFADLPLDFAPGERAVHSNSNYNVLALLVEKWSGLSFGDFLEQKIFGPLAMTASGHHDDAAEIIPRRATGYTPVGIAGFSRAPWLDWSVKTGNGSLYSTVEDLYRFDRGLVAGKLIPKTASALLFEEHFENSGYGWFVRPRFGDRELYINGRSPGFGSYFGRLEANDLTVIVLGNLYSSQPTDIARDLMALVLGEAYDPPAFSADPLPAETLSQLVGAYVFGDDFYSPNARYEITGAEGHLLANGDWLMPAGNAFIHRIYGSELEFLRDESGLVNSVSWDGFLGRRVEPDDPP